MNNIIELNQSEVLAVSGGSSFGSFCGYAGTIVGIFAASLEFARKYQSGPSVPVRGAFYKLLLINTRHEACTRALISAANNTLLILGAQMVTSWVFATAGNTMVEIYEGIFGKSE